MTITKSYEPHSDIPCYHSAYFMLNSSLEYAGLFYFHRQIDEFADSILSLIL